VLLNLKRGNVYIAFNTTFVASVTDRKPMKYEEKNPDEDLINFVKCFWTSETLTKNCEYTILPDGYFDLIVEIKKDKISDIKLTGIWIIPIEVKIEIDTKIFAVRLKPLAIELLENVNLKPVLNSLIHFDGDFIGIGNLALNNFCEFCNHIENYLKDRIQKIKALNNCKICLFNEIYKGEVFNVQELSERTFWPSRQINRYFNLTFGLSLKEYLNIIRCNQTFKDIANNILAPQSSYFDQSHLIKEIKKYTGATPKELNKNRNDRFLQLLTLKKI
jgi:AraC-like DNA-binding protein